MSDSFRVVVCFPLKYGNVVLCCNHEDIIGVADDTYPGGMSSFRMLSKVIFQSRDPRTDPCGTLHVTSFLIMPAAVCSSTSSSGVFTSIEIVVS